MVLPPRQGCNKRSTRASLQAVKAHCKSFRKRVAAAKAEASKVAQQARKAASGRACRLVAAKLEAYQKGLSARTQVVSHKASPKQQLEAYRESLQAKQKVSRTRIAAARVESIKNVKEAQKVQSLKELRKRVATAKLEAYEKGQEAQKKRNEKVCKKQRLNAYREGLQAKKVALGKTARKRVAAAKLEAYNKARTVQKAESNRELKKRVAAAKIEAYQMGKTAQECQDAARHNVLKRQQLETFQEGLQVKKRSFSKAARKRIAAARLEAYKQAKKEQKGKTYRQCRKRVAEVQLEADEHREKAKQIVRKRIAAARLEAYQEALKTQKAASSKASRKLIAESKRDAYQEGYVHGVSCGATEQSQPDARSKPAVRKARRTANLEDNRSEAKQVNSVQATDGGDSLMPNRNGLVLKEMPSPMVQAPVEAKQKSSQSSGIEALCAFPTPLRKRSAAPFQAPGGKSSALVRAPKKPTPLPSIAASSAELLWRLDVQSSASSSSADTLEEFLNEGVMRSGAFKLRLKQVGQATCCEGFGEVSTVSREIDIIVDGKCSLPKLNQIIVESFSEGEGAFTPSKRGVTVLGSHFAVSRPLELRSRCNKVVICSEPSALRIGSAADFVNDRHYTVSQLFRTMSTLSRIALGDLEGEAPEIEVIYACPSLSAKVNVSLHDHIGSRYGRKPLSQIVRSSFLSVEELQAKNIMIQAFL